MNSHQRRKLRRQGVRAFQKTMDEATGIDPPEAEQHAVEAAMEQ